MVLLVGYRGAGKDDQEVLWRNMAPRLQVELAFGVLLCQCNWAPSCSPSWAKLGRKPEGPGDMDKAPWRWRVPGSQEVNLGWDIWRQSSQVTDREGTYIECLGDLPLCPRALGQTGASHSHEDLEPGGWRHQVRIHHSPETLPPPSPLTQNCQRTRCLPRRPVP